MTRSYVLALCLAAGSAACGIDARVVGVEPDAGVAGPEGSGGSSGRLSPDASVAGAGGSATPSGQAGSGGVAGSGGAPGDSGGAAGNAGGTGPDIMPLPACADRLLAEPGTAVADTLGAVDDFSLACGAGASEDVSFYWVAPVAGYYAFDTFGSAIDTALGLVAPACDGTELACNDEGGVPPQSELVRELSAGEELVIVVDGKSGTSGAVALNVNRVTCPGIDLNLQPLPTLSTTLDGTDTHQGACGGAAQREKAFRWKAPAAGLYRFSVTSEEMTPALYVEQGARCGGLLLGCNTAGFESAASVIRRLEAGEVVSLIVEGTDAPGSFSLNVEDLSLTSTCPSEPPLDSLGDPVSATLLPDDPSVLTASCAVAEQVAQPGGRFPLPEHTFPFSTGGGLECDVYITTDAAVAVYVLEGLQCGGRELGCQRIDTLDTEVRVDVALGDVTSSETFDFVVAVELTSPLSGPANYTLSTGCFTF